MLRALKARLYSKESKNDELWTLNYFVSLRLKDREIYG